MAAALLALIAACGPRPASTGAPAFATQAALNVFAAASLSDAFGEIGAAFEAQHPGTTVVFNVGGSNQLAEQINQGAPADVFASANSRQMDAAVEGGRIVDGTQQPFARNRLAVILPAGNPAGLRALEDLARPGLTLVLAAPQVPVGQYSLDFLDRATGENALGPHFKEAVLKNVVSYEENVKAVYSKVALGEADAGIVYTSDVAGGEAARVVRLEIPDEWNTVATYPIAPVRDSAHPDLARAFVAYVLSPEGQQTLARFGFIPAAP